jgi:hypothetical protein
LLCRQTFLVAGCRQFALVDHDDPDALRHGNQSHKRQRRIV